MGSPLNYIIQTPDPLAKVMEGFQTGTAIRRQPLLEQREAEDRARIQVEQGQADTAFGNTQTLFGQQQADRVSAQAAAASQQQAAMQMRTDLEALAENPNATAADYTGMALRYPQLGDELRANWDTMDTANRESTFLGLGQVYAAVSSGNTDVAVGLLVDRITAMRNSGREDEAKKTEVMLEVLRADPSAAQTSIGLAMAAVNPDDFSKMFETLEAQRRETSGEDMTRQERNAELSRMALEDGLTEAKKNKLIVETRNMTLQAARDIFEFEALQESGGVTSEDVFNMEDKLRKQYVARTEGMDAINISFDKLRAAADIPGAETGAGDVALIFSFMKMLDPTSVVRESEFALAQSSGGLLSSLQNSLTKAQSGEFMTPVQRGEMVALASRFRDATQAGADRVKADLMLPVNNYDLNPENVFGVPNDQQVLPDAHDAGSPALTGAQGLFQTFGSGN